MGTIVRVGPRQESVFVKWDRSPNKMYCYTWPDPSAEILAPSSFREIPHDVLTLQENTNLSSAAVEKLLQRSDNDSEQVAILLREGCKCNETFEQTVREKLQAFHRVRILPDTALIQEWFDRMPPCQCSNPRCNGGLKWNRRAERHLGREGYVIKIDDSDDSVLVRTAGPCTCEVWVPRLAVEPAFDPDLEDEPLFKVNSRVECRMQSGWEPGTVKQVFWQGHSRTGPHPFEVLLDNGSTTFVPGEDLIRPIPGIQTLPQTSSRPIPGIQTLPQTSSRPSRPWSPFSFLSSLFRYLPRQ